MIFLDIFIIIIEIIIIEICWCDDYDDLPYSGDHAPLEYIALHSIVLQCTVYTQVSNGTIDDHRNFFWGFFLRIFLDKIF